MFFLLVNKSKNRLGNTRNVIPLSCLNQSIPWPKQTLVIGILGSLY